MIIIKMKFSQNQSQNKFICLIVLNFSLLVFNLTNKNSKKYNKWKPFLLVLIKKYL